MILRKNCILLLHAARSPSTSMSPVTTLFLWDPPPCGDGVTTIVTPGPAVPLFRAFSGANSWPFLDSPFPTAIVTEVNRVCPKSAKKNYIPAHVVLIVTQNKLQLLQTVRYIFRSSRNRLDTLNLTIFHSILAINWRVSSYRLIAETSVKHSFDVLTS